MGRKISGGKADACCGKGLVPKKNTLDFSNLGKVTLNPLFAPYITGMKAIASPTHQVPVKIVACSVNDDFSMTLTSKLCDNTLSDNILHKLTESGLSCQADYKLYQ